MLGLNECEMIYREKTKNKNYFSYALQTINDDENKYSRPLI